MVSQSQAATLITRMARVMRAHEAAHGTCTYRQLLNAGFTPAEIRAHGDTAIARAAQLRAANEPGCVLGAPDPIKIRKAADRRAVRSLTKGPHNDLRWSEVA